MKAFFVNRGLGFFRGGGENFDLNIARALQQAGVGASFITGRPLFGGPPYPVEGFDTVYLRTPYLRDAGQRMPRGGGYVMLADRRLFATACIRYLRRSGAGDILQVCSIPEVVQIKRYRRLPVVVRFPGPPWRGDARYIAMADRVIASGDAVDRIRKEFRPDVVDIPVGVDSVLFRPCDGSAVREHFGLVRGATLVYAGRLVPVKQVDFLIEAIGELPHQTRLFIVGEGPLETTLRARAVALGVGDRVAFAGAVPQRALASYYCAGDIFVLSSAYDNFPNAIIEAMACGLPVVAPRVGGIPMQVEDGVTGFLYEPGDRQGFRDRVTTLLGDAALRMAMGRAGRDAVVRRFSWEESAGKLQKVYEELL